jgi:hypothetical protein
MFVCSFFHISAKNHGSPGLLGVELSMLAPVVNLFCVALGMCHPSSS